MANWKKMAEAFGRAMSERVGNGNRAARAAVNESEIAKAAHNGVTVDPDIDAIRAYRKGQSEGVDNYIAGRERAPLPPSREEPRRSDVSRKISEIEDENTDDALVANRQKEWDDAFKSAKEHVKRGYGDSYPEDMASEGADAFEKQLWDVIDDLKAQGRSVEDILGALKSMGQK